jgi:RimJ/RimL family protein N-acetyltransferase
MQLDTPRLVLRPWEDSDSRVLYELASDPAVGEMAGWKPHGSEEESLGIIRTVFAKPSVFAVVLRAANRPIGCVGLDRDPQILRKGPKDAELGYWIGRTYWNQGYATEAVSEVIRYGFEEEGITKIWCQALDSNRQSARVQEKCGFRFDHRGVFSNPYVGEVVTSVSVLSKKDWQRSRRRSSSQSPVHG